MKKKNAVTRFLELSDDARDREVARFDKEEIDIDELKPLARGDREALKRAARRGRPPVGQGARRVLITLEGGMLKKADATAKRLGISRSKLIAEGLKKIMSKVA